jgi:Fe-Mn family superoxide dismutase
MGLSFPQLPFGFGELEPAMSQDTLSFHYTRHHLDHFERASQIAQREGLAHLSLERLVVAAARTPRMRTLYRHAAEACNHACFWRSMRAGGGGVAHGAIGECLRRRFGSHERFVRRFQGAAATVFGNGWLWLTWKADRLRLVVTAAGDTPITRGHFVLLAVDLWEHAYYLDHQNRRSAFLRTFLGELVDWDGVDALLESRGTAGT